MPTAACGDGRQWWETAVSFVGGCGCVPFHLSRPNGNISLGLFHLLIFAIALLGDIERGWMRGEVLNYLFKVSQVTTMSNGQLFCLWNHVILFVACRLVLDLVQGLSCEFFVEILILTRNSVARPPWSREFYLL